MVSSAVASRSLVDSLVMAALVRALSLCFAVATASCDAIVVHHGLPHSGAADQLLQISGPGSCLFVNCSKPAAACMLNSQCREAALCNYKCLNKTDSEACNLLCELTYGYNSSQYRQLMQCMSDHGCLPKSPSDGKCLAGDTDTVKNLTDLSQVKGKWWILRGLNCGQPGWPAAFDYFPCQRDEFVFESGQWIDHINLRTAVVQTTPVLHRLYTLLLMYPLRSQE